MTTLRATRKGKQQRASNVHVQTGACQRTGARQALGDNLTILCDSQKHITCLDIHCNACLKHFNSSIDQNQRRERDEDLLFVAPTLMPKLTVICHTRPQPWGYGHHPRGSRMQQRTHINITRPLISTQHGSPRHILEGRFKIKSNKDSGGVSLREVLNGFDHRACSVWSSNSMLQRSSTVGH